jgi:hypothetical protein
MDAPQTFLCELHRLPHQYVCAVSEWHFQPLCPTCLIDHSQQHAKSKSPMLLADISQVSAKALQLKQQFTDRYKCCAKAADQVSQQLASHITIDQALDDLRRLIIEEVDRQVVALRKQLVEREQGETQELVESIKLAVKALGTQSVRMACLVDRISNDETLELAKLLYFKEDTDTYFQELE